MHALRGYEAPRSLPSPTGRYPVGTCRYDANHNGGSADRVDHLRRESVQVFLGLLSPPLRFAAPLRGGYGRRAGG